MRLSFRGPIIAVSSHPLYAAKLSFQLGLQPKSLLAFAGSLAWSLVGGVVYLFLKQREHLDEVTKAPLAEEPGEAP